MHKINTEALLHNLGGGLISGSWWPFRELICNILLLSEIPALISESQDSVISEEKIINITDGFITQERPYGQSVYGQCLSVIGYIENATLMEALSLLSNYTSNQNLKKLFVNTYRLKEEKKSRQEFEISLSIDRVWYDEDLVEKITYAVLIVDNTIVEIYSDPSLDAPHLSLKPFKGDGLNFLSMYEEGPKIKRSNEAVELFGKDSGYFSQEEIEQLRFFYPEKTFFIDKYPDFDSIPVPNIRLRRML